MGCLSSPGLPSTAQNDRAFHLVCTPGPFSRGHAWVFPGHCPLLGAVAVPSLEELVVVSILPDPMSILNPVVGGPGGHCSLGQEKKGFLF